MGMGIAYTEIAEEERAHLRKLLSSLSDAASAKAAPLQSGTVANAAVASAPITDPTEVLQAIIQFFQTRTMLSRQDFWELVRRSQDR